MHHTSLYSSILYDERGVESPLHTCLTSYSRYRVRRAVYISSTSLYATAVLRKIQVHIVHHIRGTFDAFWTEWGAFTHNTTAYNAINYTSALLF